MKNIIKQIKYNRTPQIFVDELLNGCEVFLIENIYYFIKQNEVIYYYTEDELGNHDVRYKDGFRECIMVKFGLKRNISSKLLNEWFRTNLSVNFGYISCSYVMKEQPDINIINNEKSNKTYKI